MLGYAKRALNPFKHSKPAKGKGSPFAKTKLNYGAKKQYAQQETTAKPVDKNTK